MAENFTPIEISNTANGTSLATAINENFNTVTTLFEDVVSLSGQAPNTMQTSLDMNSNNIFNLPSPASVDSPARLIDVISNPTIQVPPVGTSGSTVPLLNANNTFSGQNTFNNSNALSGNNTFSGQNTFNNSNQFTAGNTFSGANLFSNSNTFTGNNAFEGNDTHTGQQTFTQILGCFGGFKAYLGGSTQTYVTPSPNNYVQLAAGTVVFNTNSCYNALTYTFTPPTGTQIVHLDAHVWGLISSFTGTLDQVAGQWIKNFTINGSGFETSGTDIGGAVGATVSAGSNSSYQTVIHASNWDVPNPGDYYGFFVFMDNGFTGTNMTIDNLIGHTQISGFYYI